MDRRDFIKTGAMAAAATAAAGCGFSAGRDLGNGKSPVAYKPSGKARLRLSWEPYELKLRHTFTVSGSSRTSTPDVQVKLEYDGFTGYGEASMPPYLGHTVESVCAFLQKLDLGQFNDPFRLEEIMDYVCGKAGKLPDGNLSDAPARAAVDIALHDLYGKLLGQPLWRIWGLDPGKAPLTTFTIGIDTPEVMRAKTLEAADRFKILKVKVGRPDDKEMIGAVRSVSSLPIAVDANQGWTDRQQALDEIFWLKDNGVVMVEQPLPKDRPDDSAWLTEHSPLPIFGDESVQALEDVRRARGVFDGVNIKLMKCGGLMEARKMMTYARAEGLKVMLGCMTETSCGISAVSQISPGVDFADLDGNLLIGNDPFEGVTVEDGRITLKDAPGLGLKDPSQDRG